MRPHHPTVQWLAAFLVLLLAAAVVAPSQTVSTIAELRPPIVATVDLEKIFNEIDRRAAAEIRLEEQARQFREQADAMRTEADLLKQDLELFVRGTPQYQDAEKAWKQTVLDYRALVEFSKGKLEAARASFRIEIYQEIIDAAGFFAAERQIDYVLTNDSVIEVHEGTDLQVVQQMLLRRIVYANPEFDLTDDLIVYINERG